jgi:hypothetical protein
MVVRHLEDVVADYVKRHRLHHLREHRWFAIQRTLDDAIERAGMAVSPAGKRLHHQRRIPNAVLRCWTEAILGKRRRIEKAQTFAALHDVLSELAADLHGIGELTVYDTATRLGAFLNLRPKFVYLHAGTREGARALGIDQRAHVKPANLPKAFRKLQPAEIEDVLCIYKAEIARLMQTGATSLRATGCGTLCEAASRMLRLSAREP